MKNFSRLKLAFPFPQLHFPSFPFLLFPHPVLVLFTVRIKPNLETKKNSLVGDDQLIRSSALWKRSLRASPNVLRLFAESRT